MGYSTSFSGELKFTKELKASELAELNKFLGEDCRDHKEWKNTSGIGDLSYIDLKLTKDFSGLEWDNGEKSYNMVEKVNLVIENMKIKYPDFGLSGEFLAQGEDIGDVWRLVMEDNVAYERKIDLTGKRKVTCPHCDEEFFLEDSNINESEDEECVFLFSGFRNDYLVKKIEENGYIMAETFTKKVTHLVMEDTSYNTTKKQKAISQGCRIWSIEQLITFLG